MISTEYHFYLAFENSLCDHYVTEKFFRSENFFDFNCFFLHLHEIVEELYFHVSLSLCVSLPLSVMVSVTVCVFVCGSECL